MKLCVHVVLVFYICNLTTAKVEDAPEKSSEEEHEEEEEEDTYEVAEDKTELDEVANRKYLPTLTNNTAINAAHQFHKCCCMMLQLTANYRHPQQFC